MSSHLLSFELLSPAHPEPLYYWRRGKPLGNQPNDDITQAHPHKGIPLNKDIHVWVNTSHVQLSWSVKV